MTPSSLFAAKNGPATSITIVPRETVAHMSK